MHPFHRTELLVGGPGWDRLVGASACVIGLGGVGSYAAEALIRSGLGRIVLVDFDVVCITNVNRQLHATRKTVRHSKAQLMAERAREINPKIDAVPIDAFYDADSSERILGDGYDLVLDCIDNMTAKVHLLSTCVQRGQYVISALGAGGRMDPTRVRVSDLSQTHTDGFARILRELLRARGITSGVPCVWSDEPSNELDEAAEASFRCICPDKDLKAKHSCEKRHQVQGTVAWMPSIFGLTMAGVAVNHLLGREVRDRVSTRQRMTPTAKPSRARKKALIAAAGEADAK